MAAFYKALAPPEGRDGPRAGPEHSQEMEQLDFIRGPPAHRRV